MPKYRNGKRVYGGAEADYLKRTSDERSKRNQARADAVKKGLAHKGDGKEVDHKTPLSKGGGNGSGNTRVVSRKENRKKYNK